MKKPMNNINVCPVCNAEKNDEGIACNNCGYEFAFCEFFGSEAAYAFFKKDVAEYRTLYIKNICGNSRDRGSTLSVSGDRVAFYNAVANTVFTFYFGKDEPEIISDIKQVSLSGLYSVYLKNDGSLISAGDNESGQRRLDDLDNIVFVETTPKCTYAVRKDGTVAVRGISALREEVEKWTDIKSISCEEEYAIGIKYDGSTVYAATARSYIRNRLEAVSGFGNVIKVETDAYYMLALHADGTASYVGENNSIKTAVEGWSGICDIVADGQYAVGLTSDGQIKTAGDYSPLIDFGRKEAGEWSDMAFIAEGRSVIAGITRTGELKMAGLADNKSFVGAFNNLFYRELVKNKDTQAPTQGI